MKETSLAVVDLSVRVCSTYIPPHLQATTPRLIFSQLVLAHACTFLNIAGVVFFYYFFYFIFLHSLTFCL